jgi:glycosyltransferase involved in cell wall biosynthesis
VTFYSQGLLDRARSLGLERSGLRVIYPPVADDFRPRDSNARSAARRQLGLAEPLIVLNVKRLHPLAGQRFLLEAFARVCAQRSDVRLVICGEGAEREPLRRQADALGISARVTFTGLIPNSVVADYMAAADVFALPSLLEALPTVAVEALASGTPVVSADHPGGVELHAIFGDDVAVVPREDAEPLADALAARLADPRRALPETAERLNKSFRPAAVVDAFADVYRQTSRRHA